MMRIHQHLPSPASGSCVGRPTVDAYTSTFVGRCLWSAKFVSTWLVCLMRNTLAHRKGCVSVVVEQQMHLLVSQTINTAIRHCAVGHHIGLHTFKQHCGSSSWLAHLLLCHLIQELLFLFATIKNSRCRSTPVELHSRTLRTATLERVWAGRVEMLAKLFVPSSFCTTRPTATVSPQNTTRPLCFLKLWLQLRILEMTDVHQRRKV